MCWLNQLQEDDSFRDSCTRKGRVEMRGGGAATLAGRRAREEKHAVILVLE